MGKRTRDGLPTDAREWAADDWRDLHTAMETVRRLVGKRHAADPALLLACPHCRGSGRVELSDTYRETFARLKGRPGEFTGADLGREWQVSATRINNQLSALERHGLLTSRRAGRQRFFKVAG